MSLYLRDNIVITPRLRDGMPTTGAITNMTLSNNMSGFTEVMDVGTYTEGMVFIQAGSKSGSPTLDCNIQYSMDKVNFVDSGDSFTQITANGLFFKKLTANFGRYIRLRVKLASGGSYVVTMGIALKG